MRAMLDPMQLRPDHLDDIFIDDMANVLNILRARMMGREESMYQYQEAFAALRLWQDNRGLGGKRWQVEGYILAGATNEQLNQIFEFRHGPNVYEYYRKLFFDVDDYLDNHNILLSNVLAPAYAAHSETDQSNLFWKRIAIDSDVPAFHRFIKMHTSAVDLRTKDKVKYTQEQNLMLNSANLSYKASIINERSMNTISMASEHMHIPATDTTDMQKAALNESIAKVIDRMEPMMLSSRERLEAGTAVQLVDQRHHMKHMSSEKAQKAKKMFDRWQVKS
jgi:hypothetical protein